MSSSFELDAVDDLTTGTLGEPGRRIFYLQAVQGPQVVTLRLEKAQVAALCGYLDAMLADLAPIDDVPVAGELTEPIVAEWVVGTLGVSYDEAVDQVVLMAREVLDDDHDSVDPPAEARFRATRAQVAAFVQRGRELVSAGRPMCQLCGGPMDPEGHACVRANGHRKLER